MTVLKLLSDKLMIFKYSIHRNIAIQFIMYLNWFRVHYAVGTVRNGQAL